MVSNIFILTSAQLHKKGLVKSNPELVNNALQQGFTTGHHISGILPFAGPQRGMLNLWHWLQGERSKVDREKARKSGQLKMAEAEETAWIWR